MSNMKATLPSHVTVTVMEGTLHLYQKWAFKKSKTYYAMLIAASSSGVGRLEFYECEKHSLTLKPTFFIVGSDVVKVEKTVMEPKEMRNAFLISARDQHFTFFVESPLQCDKWVKCIQKTLLGTIHGSASCPENTNITEVNDLYESVEKAPQTYGYLVNVDEATRTKMDVDGQVRLIVEKESISVITLSGNTIVRWNLKDIRRFSHSHKTFSLEAGRKSALGEGNFVFLTDKGESIHDLINNKRKVLKEKIGKETREPSSSQTLKVPDSLRVPQTIVTGQCWESNPRSCTPYSGQTHATLNDATYSNWTSSPRDGIKSLGGNQDDTSIATNSEYMNSPLTEIYSEPCTMTDTSTATNTEYMSPPLTEIYSEPRTMTDAWMTYARKDSEETSIYSNQDFIRQEKLDSHCGQGTPIPQLDNKSIKEEPQEEALYAQVDYSKKSKNRK